jgi:hypothetical protein
VLIWKQRTDSKAQFGQLVGRMAAASANGDYLRIEEVKKAVLGKKYKPQLGAPPIERIEEVE